MNSRCCVDTNDTFQQACSQLALTIYEKKAKVTADPLPTLLADEQQLRQIFQNLLSNALKFHKPDQTPEIHVSSQEEDERWVFSITDRGIGIDPKHFVRIFRIFQRLHIDDSYGGTGIGLSIVKKMVERHQGKVWVESQPGQGASFYFSLAKTLENPV